MGRIEGLYVIVQPYGGRTAAEIAELAVRGGAKVIQLRWKGVSTRRLLDEAYKVAEVCRKLGAVFIVNDRADVALLCGADGVHVGEEDLTVAEARAILGERAVVGRSVDTPEGAEEAEREGASYVSIGPIFPTSTKPDAGRPLGLRAVAEAKRRVRIPLVAIGGINAENVAQVVRAGADAVAVVSAVCFAPDPEGAAEEMARRIEEARG